VTNVPIGSLSPHEYLEYLQHRHYGDRLPPFAADVGDVLTANLIASLPEEHRRQLERIAIGVLPTKSVNAWVASVPSGGEVIGFDFGTMSFLLALNKLLLSRINLFGFEPVLDLQIAAAQASATVKNFFTSGDFTRLSVTPRRMLLAASLSNVQTSFVVGHELGHILLGHLRRYHDNGPPEHPHDQEFAADARGAELIMSSLKHAQNSLFGPADSIMALSGVDIFFTYMAFIDKVLGRPPDGSISHPPATQRRKKLRDRFWNELPENARSLAVAAENLFDDFALLERRKEEH
jgi:hypothetical protein